jgi:hypothetical protein
MSSRGNRRPARRATVGIGALEVYSRPKACEESTVNRPIRMPLAWPMTSRLASADWSCSRAQLACSAAASCEPSTAPIVPDSQSNAPGSVPKRLSIPAVRPFGLQLDRHGVADPPSPRRHGSTSAIGARPGSRGYTRSARRTAPPADRSRYRTVPGGRGDGEHAAKLRRAFRTCGSG